MTARLLLQIIGKNKQTVNKFLLLGFIVAFTSVALYLLPFTLNGLYVYSTNSLNSGASHYSPGYLQKQTPSDPMQPGASQFSPGHQIPPNPIEPGASQFSPGQLNKESPVS